MTIKTIIAAFSFVLVAGSVSAQDKIYQSNGEIIQAKILRVGANVIVYKPLGNDPWAPRMTISKDKVDKILFEDGCESVFNGEEATQNAPLPPGLNNGEGQSCCGNTIRSRNIFAMAPLQFTEAGIGLSFSYERFLDRSGVVSFILPFVSTFNPVKNSLNYNNENDYMYYLMPGIKIYPGGSNGKVKYAIGPSFVIGAGEMTKYDYYYSYSSSFSSGQTHNNKYVLGVTVNNSINFKPTTHFYLGLDLGFGFTYMNRFGDTYQGMGGLVNGGLKIGYMY